MVMQHGILKAKIVIRSDEPELADVIISSIS
jgi:hypothetical protein